jgi:hypothetical protein
VGIALRRRAVASYMRRLQYLRRCQRLSMDKDAGVVASFEPDCVAAPAACHAALVMVEIEEVPVQILYGELPQSPGLFFQRIDDVRT